MFKSLKYFFIEEYNKIRDKKKKYRFVIFIKEVGEISDDNTIMEAMEVMDYSERLAYRSVIDAMIKKYGSKYGFDIRKS